MRLGGWLALVLVAAGLSGCLGGFQDPLEEQSTTETGAGEVLALLDGGVPEIQVPVDVVLVGFEAGVADELASRLEPERVDHRAMSFLRVFPPDPENPQPPLSSTGVGAPTVPVAQFRVHQAPAALEAAFFDAVAEARVPGADGAIYDANAVEAFLAGTLPDHGLEVDPNRPALVLVHGNDVLPEDHAYRYTYPSGYLEPVRVFGERKPLLVADLSARPDPYVTSDPGPLGGILLPNEPPDDYDRPIPASGDEAVEAAANAVVEATHFRLLQGSIYPVTTRPCHALTLVLGIRATGVTHALPTHAQALELVDVEGLEASFENLTGRDNVFVDLDVRMLPQDDPVLDAASRGGLGGNDAVRWWIDENWETYWVPHEGCEPYVSFLVFGDAVDPISFGVGGYDTERSHRISFSVVDGRNLLTETYRGPAEETVHQRPDSRDGYDWVNLFYAHEAGHTVGQRHPHDISTMEGSATDRSFSSVWSVMSYQTGDRVVDFGAVDRANYQRNRAGWLVQAAVEADLDGTGEFERALAHLEDYRWLEAGRVLDELLAGQP